MSLPEGLSVRAFRPADAGQYVELRKLLWPHQSLDSHIKDIATFLNRPEDNAVFVVTDVKGNLFGLVEVGVRPYAEGCETGPVAYVEGWFVAVSFRKRGLGRALFKAGEEWAAGKGFKEIASDTDLGDEESREAHQALGCREVGTIHCFAKKLYGP